MPESEVVFEEAAFVDLALLAAARVGAGLSLLELELWEPERVFSPLAEDEVSDLLFDLKERLSAGIFCGLGVASSSGEQNEDRGTGSRGRGDLRQRSGETRNRTRGARTAPDTASKLENREDDEGRGLYKCEEGG
jgi:hypothetical protein